MKDIITRKYRLAVKTIGYIGWSLFWLLIWDVLVTIDFMLFFNSKFTLPLIPLTLLGSALVVLVSFRNSSATTAGGRHARCGGAGERVAQLRPADADPDRRPG